MKGRLEIWDFSDKKSKILNGSNAFFLISNIFRLVGNHSEYHNFIIWCFGKVLSCYPLTCTIVHSLLAWH